MPALCGLSGLADRTAYAVKKNMVEQMKKVAQIFK